MRARAHCCYGGRPVGCGLEVLRDRIARQAHRGSAGHQPTDPSRGDDLRVISFRIANRAERRIYEGYIEGGTGHPGWRKPGIDGRGFGESKACRRVLRQGAASAPDGPAAITSGTPQGVHDTAPRSRCAGSDQGDRKGMADAGQSGITRAVYRQEVATWSNVGLSLADRRDLRSLDDSRLWGRYAGTPYTEKYFAFGLNTTSALVDCSGCNCHSSDSDTPIRSAPSSFSNGAWSSSFGQAG